MLSIMPYNLHWNTRIQSINSSVYKISRYCGGVRLVLVIYNLCRALAMNLANFNGDSVKPLFDTARSDIRFDCWNDLRSYLSCTRVAFRTDRSVV